MIMRRLHRGGLIAFEAYDYYAEFGRCHNGIRAIDSDSINRRVCVNRNCISVSLVGGSAWSHTRTVLSPLAGDHVIGPEARSTERGKRSALSTSLIQHCSRPAPAAFPSVAPARGPARRALRTGRNSVRTRTIGSIVGACCLTIAAVAASGPAVADSTSPLAAARPVYATNSDDGQRLRLHRRRTTPGTRPWSSATRSPRRATAPASWPSPPDARRRLRGQRRTCPARSLPSRSARVGRLAPLPRAAGTVHTGGDHPARHRRAGRDGHTLYVAHVDDQHGDGLHHRPPTAASTKLQVTDTTAVDEPARAGRDARRPVPIRRPRRSDNPETRPDSVGAITAFAIGKRRRPHLGRVADLGRQVLWNQRHHARRPPPLPGLPGHRRDLRIRDRRRRRA